MANLTFFVGYSTTIEGVVNSEPSIDVYAEDLGLCDECVDTTASCWACLQKEQQVFSDSSLTIPVQDGFYFLNYSDEAPKAIWNIIGGYPQEAGFYNGI